MKCPRCATTMKTVDDPDLTIDRCPTCEGIFLDPGELNVLATGLAGDIETCSVRYAAADDLHPDRTCPRCEERQMEKVNLLALSDLVFDFCPACQGFFLDAGEIEEMNALLESISGTKGGDELRVYHGGRLVRVDRLPGVATNLAGTGEPTTCVRVLVYLKKPLGLGLRVYQQGFVGRLALSLGLSRSPDIKTGDAAFDRNFLVLGDDAEAVRGLLNEELRRALLRFAEEGPSVITSHGRIELLDDRVAYTEGPYRGDLSRHLGKDAAPVITACTRFAEAIEGA